MVRLSALLLSVAALVAAATGLYFSSKGRRQAAVVCGCTCAVLAVIGTGLGLIAE